ncbi:DUF4350 domain-containing protein [Changchengzhania lutea]|uniref:DUF4350 domain-containing protein n=1 Tax=Changchengzhania lutea TaxID=2049305 RepID=UPI00115C72D2|nr:DUF4350 domain-containing protein [Changchengzhania lutea]
MIKNVYVFATLICSSINPLQAQRQYADTLYRAPIEVATYKNHQGSTIVIDEGHHNFHTKDGRYKPFATVLEQDGYRVIGYKGDFNEDSLKNIEILVISNALHESNVGNWKLPNPSAFTPKEIHNLRKWVKKGGKLFLLADHMPMAGASQELAKVFGYEFNNGFASDSTKTGSDLFYRKNGTLIDSEITNGCNNKERVDSIRSFTGQAFNIPKKATPILKCGVTWVSYQTEIPWQIDENTPVLQVGGWFQGAYQKYGKGKLVVFGEAAMFSAQIAELEDRSFKAGMNKENAKYNYRLLLNIIHWLDE